MQSSLTLGEALVLRFRVATQVSFGWLGGLAPSWALLIFLLLITSAKLQSSSVPSTSSSLTRLRDGWEILCGRCADGRLWMNNRCPAWEACFYRHSCHPMTRFQALLVQLRFRNMTSTW
jgi:hypothetical protein